MFYVALRYNNKSRIENVRKMKTQELKGRIRAGGYTQKRFSDALGISPASLSRKLSGSVDFTLGEIERIRQLLSLSPEEAADIFFS